MLDFEYAIFDMDGTLVDSMKQWRETGPIFLRKIGIEPTRQLLRVIRTVPYEGISQILNERYGMHFTGVEIENEFFKIMRYSYAHHIDEKEGISEYLSCLKAQQVTLCVATGTCQELTLRLLKKLDLLKYFSFVITCPEVGKDKHSPLIFEEALARLGGEKERTMIFEDSLTAIKSAAKAGFRTTGVYDEVSIQDRRTIKKIAEQYVYSWSECMPQKEIV